MSGAQSRKENYAPRVRITRRRGLPIEGVIVVWTGWNHFEADQWNAGAFMKCRESTFEVCHNMPFSRLLTERAQFVRIEGVKQFNETIV